MRSNNEIDMIKSIGSGRISLMNDPVKINKTRASVDKYCMDKLYDNI